MSTVDSMAGDRVVATITRRERDQLRGQVGLLLRGDHPGHWENDRAELEAFAGEIGAYVAIVDQLGWDADGDPRDVYEITMPAADFAATLREVRDDSTQILSDERPNLGIMAGPDGLATFGFSNAFEQRRSIKRTREYIAREERTVAVCDAILERMATR